MHGLEIIKALNANRDESGQLPHNEAGFDSANNKGGIQGHSQGPIFPVVEYFRGDRRFSKAPFAPNCELEAPDADKQRSNSYRLKRLEQLTDEVCKSLDETKKFNAYYVKANINPNEGYLVILDGFQEYIDLGFHYGKVYDYLFRHRDLLSSGHYVGGHSWSGKIFISVYGWCKDLAEAQVLAETKGCGIIWDCDKATAYHV